MPKFIQSPAKMLTAVRRISHLVHVFGPVPSRRLGKSLGVNNIPFKHCSYSCVYCQIGRTDKLTVSRRKFFDPVAIFREVEKKIEKAGKVDYISFVPDGEPTLDVNLGVEIDMLKNFGKIAVITNASLLFREDVRCDLSKADLVSLKVDAVEENTWRRINRPHSSLDIEKILDGMLKFAEDYDGILLTETMLIEGYSTLKSVEKVAEFLGILKPHKAYLAIPTRPPAEKVKGVSVDFILKAKQIFDVYVESDLLIEPESNEFTINSKEDVLSIASVHPLRKDILEKYLKKLNLRIEDLANELEEIEFNGIKYYRRS